MGQGTGDRKGGWGQTQQAWSHSGGTGCCWQWHHSPARAQPSQAAGHPQSLGHLLAWGRVCHGHDVSWGGKEVPEPGLRPCFLHAHWTLLPAGFRARCCAPAPAPRGSECWPRAARPCFMGCVLWCSCTPQGLRQAFRKGLASPHGHGDKGDVVHSSTQLSSCAAQTSPAGPGERVATLGGQEGAGGAR